MANACAHLLTLPNEMFEAVADLLDTASLLSLRQVSSEVAAAVDTPFIKRYFSRRTHVYTQHGLRALADIVSVLRLSAYLQEVKLVVLQLSSSSKSAPSPPPSQFAHLGSFSKDFWTGEEKRPELTVPTREEYENRKRTREQQEQSCKESYEVWVRFRKAWDAECEAISNREQTVKLLTTAFKALSIKCDPVKITIANSGCKPWPYVHDGTVVYGVYHLHELLGGVAALERGDFEPAHRCDAAATIVLSALAESGLVVQQLDLCSDNQDDGLSMRPFEIPGFLGADLVKCFSQLTVLKLSLGYGDSQWDPSYTENFDKIMGAAVNLKSLDLHWPQQIEMETEQVEQTVFGGISWVLMSKCLQNVRIHEMSVREEDLAAFLQAHRGTLRTVKLERVRICDWGSWRSFMRGMVQDLSLDRLELYSLKKRDWDAGFHPREGTLGYLREHGAQNSFFDFKGVAAVKAGVERLCQFAQYQWDDDW